MSMRLFLDNKKPPEGGLDSLGILNQESRIKQNSFQQNPNSQHSKSFLNT